MSLINNLTSPLTGNLINSLIEGATTPSVPIPSTIEGLELFLKATADNITFDVTFPTQVAAWNDLSGNERNLIQAITSEQPVFQESSLFNSKNGLLFEGTDTLLSTSDKGFFNNLEEFTGFFVIRPATIIAQQPFFVELGSSGDSYFRADPTEFVAQKNQFAAPFSGSPSNQNHILRWEGEKITPTTYTQRVFDYGIQIGSPVTNNLVSIGSLNIKLGRRSGGSYYEGTIHEILIYNRFLSPSEITTIEDYLLNEWGGI